MTITNENDDAYANAAFINNSEEIVAGWEKKANHFRLKKLKSGKAKLEAPMVPLIDKNMTFFNRIPNHLVRLYLCMGVIGLTLINHIGLTYLPVF